MDDIQRQIHCRRNIDCGFSETTDGFLNFCEEIKNGIYLAMALTFSVRWDRSLESENSLLFCCHEVSAEAHFAQSYWGVLGDHGRLIELGDANSCSSLENFPKSKQPLALSSFFFESKTDP